MTSELTPAAGDWTGSNGFRMMPGDTFADGPAAATVTIAAGGNMTSFAYTWSHPDDGPQDGLLVFGSAGDDGAALIGVWGDSWHQHPALISMPGRRTAPNAVEFTGDYGGGWLWRIAIDTAVVGALAMRMDNVVPEEHGTAESPAGPYPAMVMTLRPAGSA